MNKPRLIDANALLDVLALEPMENRTYWRANEIVLEQPTAYDIDGVIADLKELKNDISMYCYEVDNAKRLMEVAIQMVEAGGKME